MFNFPITISHSFIGMQPPQLPVSNGFEQDHEILDEETEEVEESAFIDSNELDDILAANNYPNFHAMGLEETVLHDAIGLLEKIRKAKCLEALKYDKMEKMIRKKFKHGNLKGPVPKVIEYLYYAAAKRTMQLLFHTSPGELDLHHIMNLDSIANDPLIANVQRRKPEEYAILRRFVRAVYIAHEFMDIPGNRNKGRYTFLAKQLEGAGRNYANGGARAKDCKLRHHVIELITGVPRGQRRRTGWKTTLINKCMQELSSDSEADEDETSNNINVNEDNKAEVASAPSTYRDAN